MISMLSGLIFELAKRIIPKTIRNTPNPDSNVNSSFKNKYDRITVKNGALKTNAATM